MALHWVQLGLGLWIIVSPWIMGFSGIAFMTWSNVLVGIAMVIINAWRIFLPEIQEKGTSFEEQK